MIKAILTTVSAAIAGWLIAMGAAAQDTEAREILAERVLGLWHVENAAIAVFKKTGSDVIGNTSNAIRLSLPPEQQVLVLKDVAADVNEYLDQLTPFVTERAQSVKMNHFLPFLVENFDESELEELIRILESPAKRKLDALLPQAQSEYERKVVDQSSARVKPALEQLTEKVNERLRQAAVAS